MSEAPAGLRALSSGISQTATDRIVRWRLRRTGRPASVTLACVYRAANAHNVARIVADLPQVRLWALDEQVAELGHVTLGVGPGMRMDLLNKCLEGSTSEYTIFMDDDIQFVTGDIHRLLTIADRHRLDLCQPSQAHFGYVGVPLTIQRRFSGLRLTNFVEVGPLVVVGPRLRSEILPFAPDSGLGWGVDILWSRLCETHGARMAVVDAVVVRHLNPVGAAYPHQAEHVRLNAALADVGAESVLTLGETRRVIRPWLV